MIIFSILSIDVFQLLYSPRFYLMGLVEIKLFSGKLYQFPKTMNSRYAILALMGILPSIAFLEQL